MERGAGARISAGFCWPWSPDRPDGEAQIGCLYTCQALQYEHSDVIIGPDLARRDGRWVGAPSASHGRPFRNVSADDYLGYALNTYWVLATQGTGGCRFLSVDEESQDFLGNLL
ncbi:DNA/RNA helicase domain-containing protein [Actinosynnema pretiosum]|uniref:Schlafen group 3-like DNA/RNA helicase domain-containing protein n=1 Tax=Actinosynnema pretiosum TaxID=42197 RepID=A0A290ZC29_9PSEU|nr:DNA/RNA helicase domain-containing protein [Actinosynnema pretiosum]ATE56590.1 hypothetical protein CNX65_27650 [Actinosynnema pretiosum]